MEREITRERKVTEEEEGKGRKERGKEKRGKEG